MVGVVQNYDKTSLLGFVDKFPEIADGLLALDVGGVWVQILDLQFEWS